MLLEECEHGKDRKIWQKMNPTSSFSFAGCYARSGLQLIHREAGICWFAIKCKLPRCTDWRSEHLSLSLKRCIAKLRRAPTPTEVSGKPPIDFNAGWAESLFSGSKAQQYLSFLEHIQPSKAVPLQHSKFFSHLPDSMATHQHQALNTETSFLLVSLRIYTSVSCKKILLSCSYHWTNSLSFSDEWQNYLWIYFTISQEFAKVRKTRTLF